MRFRTNVTLLAVALVLATAPMLVASDAVTQCGAVQMKAVAAVYKALIAEATSACVAGSAGHPQPVDAAKLTDATNKLNAALQAAIDKFGDAQCFEKPTTTPANVISLSQNLANQFCLVPSPTPTP